MYDTKYGLKSKRELIEDLTEAKRLIQRKWDRGLIHLHRKKVWMAEVEKAEKGIEEKFKDVADPEKPPGMDPKLKAAQEKEFKEYMEKELAKNKGPTPVEPEDHYKKRMAEDAERLANLKNPPPKP